MCPQHTHAHNLYIIFILTFSSHRFTHMKPCLHHFYNTKNIIHSSHIPAVKRGVVPWVWRNVSRGKCITLTISESCLFCTNYWSLGAIEQVWETLGMNAGEPAALSFKRMEESLFQLCTTSFMASFVQREAWQTYSSLFLYRKPV